MMYTALNMPCTIKMAKLNSKEEEKSDGTKRGRRQEEL